MRFEKKLRAEMTLALILRLRRASACAKLRRDETAG
jgi:hypothetical protein